MLTLILYPPLEACTLPGKSLFKTENAIQPFKGGRVLYSCHLTVSQGLDVSTECSVNLGFMGQQDSGSHLCVFSLRDGYLPQKDSWWQKYGIHMGNYHQFPALRSFEVVPGTEPAKQKWNTPSVSHYSSLVQGQRLCSHTDPSSLSTSDPFEFKHFSESLQSAARAWPSATAPEQMTQV